jgi:hypothetical protein
MNKSHQQKNYTTARGKTKSATVPKPGPMSKKGEEKRGTEISSTNIDTSS